MVEYLSLWWVWISIGLAFGVIELLAPGFIFLGFALGAAIVAGIVTLFEITNYPALFAVFALLSLISWIGLKAAFRKQSSGARIVTRDINEN